MKDFLLDTNIVSHFAHLKMGIEDKETAKIETYISKISKNAKIFFCAINVGEIEYGYKLAPKKIKEDIKNISNHLKGYEILSIDQEIAREYYAEIRALLFEKYCPKSDKKKRRLAEYKDPITDKNIQVQENDIWICAVAKYYNLTLITADKMNAIRNVANLEIQNWII
ncbi:MAG TPA: type II toxin-antitoxin system VapC family toxin [Ignavibacteria bacterium]|nr:type II toxin-antitoxin system VapC family toxin [Ignavibacteria bacterium]